MSDSIKCPSHYVYSEIEPKDAIRAWELNFNLGNAVKYIVRNGRKPDNDAITDLRKAKQYIDFEIEWLEKHKGCSEA